MAERLAVPPVKRDVAGGEVALGVYAGGASSSKGGKRRRLVK